jgi:hypothetical protein
MAFLTCCHRLSSRKQVPKGLVLAQNPDVSSSLRCNETDTEELRSFTGNDLPTALDIVWRELT